MKRKKNTPTAEKKELHPRSLHHHKYDFDKLSLTCTELSNFVFTNKYGNKTIDFSDQDAVKTLNKALLIHFYDISFWDIPEGYLCPPIPGRADYIHNLADVLASSYNGKIPKGRQIVGLDIGVGANCIYPIIGNKSYGWDFVGSDVNSDAILNAQHIIDNNKGLKYAIKLRKQENSTSIFQGIIKTNEVFDFTMCNPPFHTSESEALEGTRRKWSNLGKKENEKLNFGGQTQELWTEGGELQFISQMIEESSQLKTKCFWFTSLISKKENLLPLKKLLQKYEATKVVVKDMAQGQKVSRFIAWTFLDNNQQEKWAKLRWKKR
ncbi:23S rRNA (adenine(1618)-N(6))-methyltransferase RlmF [Sediminitomix flava]|uniref:Ribosomal RNA large subunit methyltransferase F n=1 Tax=Sediminitomix flava TaxID=379075 RepID=A0A315ZFY0_SEDFL|nr:23S rRNA (adenine(1618)-N(6))-methyltransferase RlmF [Sediminitomix flava]PWJ44059.1 23S rRNA m(6)A-1618 methyltransferase [Sediminitomix flava]